MCDASHQIRFCTEEFVNPDSLKPLNDNALRFVERNHLVKDRHGADFIKIVRAGRMNCGFTLRNEGHKSIYFDNVFNQPDRTLVPNQDRRDCHWINYCFANGKNWQDVWQRNSPGFRSCHVSVTK